MHRYMRPLLQPIKDGQIDPSIVISRRFALDDTPKTYRMFRNKEDHCTKCVLGSWVSVAWPKIVSTGRLELHGPQRQRLKQLA